MLYFNLFSFVISYRFRNHIKRVRIGCDFLRTVPFVIHCERRPFNDSLYQQYSVSMHNKKKKNNSIVFVRISLRNCFRNIIHHFTNIPHRVVLFLGFFGISKQCCSKQRLPTVRRFVSRSNNGTEIKNVISETIAGTELSPCCQGCE